MANIEKTQVLSGQSLDEIAADMMRDGEQARKIVQVDKNGTVICAAIVMVGIVAEQAHQSWLAATAAGEMKPS